VAITKLAGIIPLRTIAASNHEKLRRSRERLFESARLAFDQQKMALARDAYASLFALLGLKDDNGFAVTHPKDVVISDEQARYLRALGETAAPGRRSVF